MIAALYRAGHFFTQESTGVTSHLPGLMQRYGIQQVETRDYTLTYHLTPEARADYAANVQRLFRTAQPFLQKWIKLPANYQALYQQMLIETQRADFTATNTLTTAWGNVMTLNVFSPH